MRAIPLVLVMLSMELAAAQAQLNVSQAPPESRTAGTTTTLSREQCDSLLRRSIQVPGLRSTPDYRACKQGTTDITPLIRQSREPVASGMTLPDSGTGERSGNAVAVFKDSGGSMMGTGSASPVSRGDSVMMYGAPASSAR